MQDLIGDTLEPLLPVLLITRFDRLDTAAKLLVTCDQCCRLKIVGFDRLDTGTVVTGVVARVTRQR